jgi:hypothetical protein
LALSLASSVSAIGGIKDFYVEFGRAYLHDAQGTRLIAQEGVWSISAVTDPNGYARAALVFQNGTLWDYFDQMPNAGLKYETSNVRQACAGYGFDAILYSGGWLTSGLVSYFDPYSATSKAVIATNARQISAGEDRDSLPMIAYVDTTNIAHEWRLGNTAGAGYTESLGWAYQASAGQNGVVALLTPSLVGSNWAWNHYDDPYVPGGGAFTTAGTMKFLAASAYAVSAGTDASGKAMTDVLFSAGQVNEYSDAWGVKNLGTGWTEVDAGLGGISDLVSFTGNSDIQQLHISRFVDGGIVPGSWTVLVSPP